MIDKESIVSKIQKLLKYNNENATEAEVQAAVDAAQRLMEKHAIEEADLREDEEYSGPERDRMNSHLNARKTTWETDLAWAVRLMVPGVDWYLSFEWVRPKFSDNGGMGGRSRRIRVIVWYGPSDLCEVARNLYDETRAVISTMAHGIYGGAYRGEGRSYCEGFAETLLSRAKSLRNASSSSAQIKAIVLSSETENNAWLQETHGVEIKTSFVRTTARHHSSAFGEGSRDGAAHDFKPGRPTSKLSAGRNALPS